MMESAASRARWVRSTRILALGFLAALVVLGCILLAVEPTQAAFPGSEGKIAFVSNRDGAAEIFTMSSTGNNLKRLTNNTTADTEPSWSANGKRIAFSASRERFGDPDIYTMNADGSNKKLVIDELSIAGPVKADTSPAFSPDGGKIVFRRNGHIFTINSDGSDLTRLSTAFDLEYSPAWSPDGTKIAFTGQSGVYVMNADGSSPVQVTQDNGGCFSPDWSPDGARITCDYGDDVYVMNSDGSDKTFLAGNIGGFRSTVRGTSAFSPGGTKVVFSADRDGDYDIFAMNDDGSEITQLTNNPARDFLPDWQPAP